MNCRLQYNGIKYFSVIVKKGKICSSDVAIGQTLPDSKKGSFGTYTGPENNCYLRWVSGV